METPTGDESYTHFRSAVAALDAGDVARLESVIDAHPSVLGYECRVGERYEEGYFAGATLLMHVAGNPIREPLPANIVEIARALVKRGVAREDAQRTIGLLLTSRQASEAGVGVPLIDLLVGAGARFDVHSPGLLDAPLLNHAPATAQALAKRGASVVFRHSAALGDLETLHRQLDQGAGQATLDDALIFSCIRGQRDAAALLVERGARGDALVSPGGATPRTALHEAANRGFEEIVDLLLAAGADPMVPDARWGGTAAGWADAGGFPDLAQKLRAATP
jgi:hypothetical protein